MKKNDEAPYLIENLSSYENLNKIFGENDGNIIPIFLSDKLPENNGKLSLDLTYFLSPQKPDLGKVTDIIHNPSFRQKFTVKSLHLDFSSLKKPEKKLARKIINLLSNFHFLEQLTLSSLQEESLLIMIIENLPKSIKDISISQSNISTKTAKSIAKVLPLFSALKRFELTDNLADQIDEGIIIASLKDLKHLKTFHLSLSVTTSEEVKLLSRSDENDQSQIFPIGPLAEFLRDSKSLREFRFKSRPNTFNETFCNFSNIIEENKTLRKIVLDSYIESRGGVISGDLIYILESMPYNKSIIDIDISKIRTLLNFGSISRLSYDQQTFQKIKNLAKKNKDNINDLCKLIIALHKSSKPLTSLNIRPLLLQKYLLMTNIHKDLLMEYINEYIELCEDKANFGLGFVDTLITRKKLQLLCRDPLNTLSSGKIGLNENIINHIFSYINIEDIDFKRIISPASVEIIELTPTIFSESKGLEGNKIFGRARLIIESALHKIKTFILRFLDKIFPDCLKFWKNPKNDHVTEKSSIITPILPRIGNKTTILNK